MEVCKKYIFFVFLLLSLVLSTEGTCQNQAECVTLDNCPGLNNQGRSQIILSLFRRLYCGFDEENSSKICCPLEFQRFHGIDLLPNKTICGTQTTDRIVGGEKTDLDEHPWVVLIKYDKPKSSPFFCGGVLISSRYVMSAAHCFEGRDLLENCKLFKVRLGEWNLATRTDCLSSDCSPDPLNVDVEEVIAHENYDAVEGKQNDIALLRLAQNVPFTDFVKPICLPVDQSLRRNTFENYDMEVAGWGKTETKPMSDVKLKVIVTVRNTQVCQEVYERANRIISKDQLCAGGIEGQDSCRGDSGGALMGQVDDSKNWMALGVVSYGPTPCGTAGWPGVYTRVTSYVDWILSNLQKCNNGVECVTVESCTDIYNTIKRFHPILLYKLLQRLHCGFDDYNIPKICCPPSFKAPESSNGSGPLSKSEALESNVGLELLPNKTVCGLQINDRIIGGQNTYLDEHPWMAIVYGITHKESKELCGGVLISSRYVMTAAHCVTSDTKVSRVVLGEWQLSSQTDCLGSECSPHPLSVDVEEVVAHENYSREGQHDDIALLRLTRNVPFTDFVKPICLPVDTKLKKKTFETYDLEVAGWGVTENGHTSDFKLKVRVPVTNLQKCRKVYKSYNITEKQICAGGRGGRDSCRGDSGGALMGQTGSEQNWMAIGVVSYGSAFCGRARWPGIYTRVSSYTDWILSKIRS